MGNFKEKINTLSGFILISECIEKRVLIWYDNSANKFKSDIITNVTPDNLFTF